MFLSTILQTKNCRPIKLEALCSRLVCIAQRTALRLCLTSSRQYSVSVLDVSASCACTLERGRVGECGPITSYHLVLDSVNEIFQSCATDVIQLLPGHRGHVSITFASVGSGRGLQKTSFIAIGRRRRRLVEARSVRRLPSSAHF